MPAPLALGAGIGHRQRHVRELEYRTHETDGLPKRQAIYLLQEQPQQYDVIRVCDWTTPVCRGALIRGPLGGKIVPQADGQATAIGPFTIIFIPVHFLFEKAPKQYTFI